MRNKRAKRLKKYASLIAASSQATETWETVYKRLKRSWVRGY